MLPSSTNATIPYGVFAGLFGLVVGSFLNVVVHRLPDGGLASLSGRSQCPRCRAQIRWYDNIPVFSWLWLGGKCRACRASISLRYPAVELLTGALFFAAWWTQVAGSTGPDHGFTPALVVTWVVLANLLALSLIDLRLRILPDELTIPMLLLGPIIVAFVPGLLLDVWSARELAPYVAHENVRAAIVSLLGVAVGAGVVAGVRAAGTRYFSSSAEYEFLGATGDPTHLDGFLARQKPRRSKSEIREWVEEGLVAILRSGSSPIIVSDPSTRLHAGDVVRVRLVREAMGFGDVKLQAAIGAFVGPEGALLVLALASLAGAVVGSINILRIFALLHQRASQRRRASRSGLWRVARSAGGTIPFGPFLAGGAAALLLARGRLMAQLNELWSALAWR